MDKENRIHWISWDKLSLRKRDGGLGFRDLYAFNLAMLARQAWRILHNPSSLCARVLSAKYFLDGNILNAKGVCGMSYVWCSILKGVKLLKQGIIWRVGNGNNIDIWNDPWIPRGTTRRTMTHKGRHLVNKVSELMDPINGGWDVALVQQTFFPEDVEAILQIPVNEEEEDYVAWHFDKKCSFSVKSAYKVAIDIDIHKPAQSSTSTSNRGDRRENFD